MRDRQRSPRLVQLFWPLAVRLGNSTITIFFFVPLTIYRKRVGRMVKLSTGDRGSTNEPPAHVESFVTRNGSPQRKGNGNSSGFRFTIGRTTRRTIERWSSEEKKTIPPPVPMGKKTRIFKNVFSRPSCFYLPFPGTFSFGQTWSEQRKIFSHSFCMGRPLFFGSFVYELTNLSSSCRSFDGDPAGGINMWWMTMEPRKLKPFYSIYTSYAGHLSSTIVVYGTL